MTHPITEDLRTTGERSATVAGSRRPAEAADQPVEFELVKVIDRSMLLNPVQLRRPYRTRDGRPLERGIYAVVWPDRTRTHAYDDHATYYGPFRAWRDASAFVREAMTGSRT